MKMIQTIDMPYGTPSEEASFLSRHPGLTNFLNRIGLLKNAPDVADALDLNHSAVLDVLDKNEVQTPELEAVAILQNVRRNHGQFRNTATMRRFFEICAQLALPRGVSARDSIITISDDPVAEVNSIPGPVLARLSVSRKDLLKFVS